MLCACSPLSGTDDEQPQATSEPDASRFVASIEDEPDTVDFQCTSIYYTVAANVFNRLVETETDGEGNILIAPSLAKEWEVSDDGRCYTFHLREGVTFSNGSALTASDVLYTFTRLLTHPDSCNRDIAQPILGAHRLESGETDQLEGFQILGDLDFAITLEEPFEAFLACLSMPGASILDEQTMAEFGDRFGKEAEATIGTGSYILSEWVPKDRMVLIANSNCWEGAPNNEGLDMRFLEEPEEIRQMFNNGELDVLDLDEVGSAAEFFMHGDIYQDKIFQVPRIGTVYVALNHTVEPLDDVRVRKALQLSLDRTMLLDAVYNGQGAVEHGIYPHGLYGFNPDLPEIPFDPEQAKELLTESGYPDGFDLKMSVKSSSTQWEITLMDLIASMWTDIGVRASISVIGEDEFMRLRKSGELPCYTAMWTADYDDPDTFLYTFFGNRQNTTFRSICYQREDIMERVRKARTIIDHNKRIEEYRDLERTIAQEDCAWIPLFSRLRTYVCSERAQGISAAWNGSVKVRYRTISITDEP